MKRKRPSKFQIFLLVCLGLFAIHRLFFRARSESEMIDKFHAHKAEFEQIRQMLQQDKNVEMISESGVRGQWEQTKEKGHELKQNISPERLKLYRSLLKELGFEDVVVSYKKIIRFYEFGGGFGGDTWGIGYAWSAVPPKPLVKSAYYQMPAQNKQHYSRIEGDWYIFHYH